MKHDLNGPGRPPGRDEQELEAYFRDELRLARAEAPSFDELAAYAEGRLEPEARALLEERLAADPALRQEAEDLRALAGEMARPRRAAARPLRWRLGWLASGAAAAAAVFVVWTRPSSDATRPNPPSLTVTAPMLATLQDAGGPWVLRSDGSLSGSADLDPRTRKGIVAALREGALPPPAGLAALVGEGGALMGEAPAATFAVVSPVGTRVMSDRPTFHWTARPGATSYEVTVFDADLTRQAASGALAATEWIPPRPLRRGRIYLWQVTALGKEGRSTSPTPPAPEARFEVATAALVAEVAGRRAAAPASHLLGAVVLTEAGLLDDAQDELHSLAAQNPASPEVARLLETQAARRRSPFQTGR